VSRTFHGRDVFAPVAARLAAGVPVAEVGSAVPVASLARLPDPVCRVGAGWAEAEVLTSDRYGNLQTVLTADQLASAGFRVGTAVGVRAGDFAAEALYGETFGSAEPGRLVLYEDSAALAALAVNGASAAALLHAAPGTVIRLTAAQGVP
jgi:S-adenosyl-L-methionine hydrolase (adenosine-forming)